MVTYFKYRKTEEKYWIEEHLLNQIKKIVLSIKEVVYFDYKLLFLFNNATNYLIYTLNII